MYRGYGGAVSAYFGGARELTLRKDRKPRDTTQYVHDLVNAYFVKRFGVKVRSEGLFATGDRHTAEKYGHPYYAFPVGQFKFVWGTHKGDPVMDTLHWTRMIENMMKVRQHAQAMSVAEKVLGEIDWHSDNLANAIGSGAEIAVLADSAILIPYSQKVPYEDIIGTR